MDERQRWEGNKDRQFIGMQRFNRICRKNNGYIAYVNEEANNRISDEDFYPNTRAPMNGEIVSAIF